MCFIEACTVTISYPIFPPQTFTRVHLIIHTQLIGHNVSALLRILSYRCHAVIIHGCDLQLVSSDIVSVCRVYTREKKCERASMACGAFCLPSPVVPSASVFLLLHSWE